MYHMYWFNFNTYIVFCSVSFSVFVVVVMNVAKNYLSKTAMLRFRFTVTFTFVCNFTIVQGLITLPPINLVLHFHYFRYTCL